MLLLFAGIAHALLRALGLTPRQLRRMVAAEAVLLSVVATLAAPCNSPGYHSASSSSSPPWPDSSPVFSRHAGPPDESGRRAIPRLIPSSIARLPRAISNELPEHGRTFPNQRCNAGS